MKPMHIAMALLSAAMFFVLAGVFMGVQLELDGTKLVVDTASDIRWQWVFIGTAVVFFFQLLFQPHAVEAVRLFPPILQHRLSFCKKIIACTIQRSRDCFKLMCLGGGAKKPCRKQRQHIPLP